MTNENKILALEIIAKSNSPKISINSPIKDSYSSVYDILIHESNSSLISELILAGFSLHMTEKGLAVEKF